MTPYRAWPLERTAAEIPRTPARYRPTGKMRAIARAALPFVLPFLLAFTLALALGKLVDPILALLGILPGLVALLFTLLWSRRASRQQLGRWARRTEDGLWLMATARFAAAGRIFEELIDESRDAPEQHAGFVLQRAKTYLRQGSIDQALALFHTVNEWNGLPAGPARTELFASLAVAHTLRGDLDEARSWQRQAVKGKRARDRGALLLCEAMLEARSGHYREVSDMISEAWPEAERAAPAADLRILRILRAFVASQLDASAPRTKEVESILEDARSIRVDQLAYLRSSWPELDSFLRTGGRRLRVESASNAASSEESKEEDEDDESDGARLLRELPRGRSA
jgi:tetratricopeptide (TPR) repeat protein